jgi:hypothetical protein
MVANIDPAAANRLRERPFPLINNFKALHDADACSCATASIRIMQSLSEKTILERH